MVHAALTRGHEGILEYPCHNGRRARWFRMSIKPLPEGGALVTHTAITSEVTLRRLLEHSKIMVLRLTAEGVPIWTSDGWNALRGPVGATSGWLDDTPEGQRELLAARLERRHGFVMDRLITTDRDGRRRHLQVSFTPDTLEDGTSRGWQAVAIDVTGIHRLLELAQVATTDPLTGFVNRARLTEWLGASAGPVGLLYLDLDHFKQVNDEHGHRAGDQVLREAADRIRSAIRPDDLACRLGGDEFVVVMEHADPAALEQVATRIVGMFRRPFVVGSGRAHLDVSIGLALRVPGEDEVSLLERADVAMYVAKDGDHHHLAWAAPPEAADG